MTNIASNYDEFTSLVLNGITNGLNNTEFGKNFTQELLKKELEQNPNLTVDEWKEIQSKVLKLSCWKSSRSFPDSYLPICW